LVEKEIIVLETGYRASTKTGMSKIRDTGIRVIELGAMDN
jgi:hypothetical protein